MFVLWGGFYVADRLVDRLTTCCSVSKACPMNRLRSLLHPSGDLRLSLGALVLLDSLVQTVALRPFFL